MASPASIVRGHKATSADIPWQGELGSIGKLQVLYWVAY